MKNRDSKAVVSVAVIDIELVMPIGGPSESGSRGCVGNGAQQGGGPKVKDVGQEGSPR